MNDCLVHERDEPLVEFTDVTPADRPGVGPDYGFVARFPAKVFLDRNSRADVWLFGRDTTWRLTTEEIRQVQEWLRRDPDRGLP